MGILEQPRITIHVTVVYTARDVMILMRANPFRGPFEGVGPGIETFLGPKNFDNFELMMSEHC
jgi:hypothetical protein